MMNADPEYRRLQFTIADLLWAMVIVAILAGTSRLPAESALHFIPSLAVLYVVKYRILALRVQPWLGLLLYFLVVAALVPSIYFRVIDVRNAYHQAPLAAWIGLPIAAFTIPTVFFLYDVLAHKRPSLKFYVLRSLVEVVMLIPLWAVVWVCIESFLGWVWIE